MKAVEKYFSVPMLILLYKVALSFESVENVLECLSSQMKATEQCFCVTLFIVLCALTFESG